MLFAMMATATPHVDQKSPYYLLLPNVFVIFLLLLLLLLLLPPHSILSLLPSFIRLII